MKLYLIGMPLSGKSVIGRTLSKKLNLDDIEFTVDTLYFIHSKDGVYTFKNLS